MFIEPRVRVEGRENSIFPDILVCSQRAVVAAIELKYVPRGKPSIDSDLSKLRAFAESESKIEVVNERFLGRRLLPVTHTLAKSALVCWAGVYTVKAINFDFGEGAKLRAKLLALHAITKRGKDACVFVDRTCGLQTE
jgi:hypothetical protein